MENALGKSNIEIARSYLELMDETGKVFFDKVEHEFNLTKQMILLITEEAELLDHQPVLKKSISLRNPYIDPINFIQIEVLKKYRQEKDPDKKEAILMLLRETVNGIAAGMKNTG